MARRAHSRCYVSPLLPLYPATPGAMGNIVLLTLDAPKELHFMWFPTSLYAIMNKAHSSI